MQWIAPRGNWLPRFSIAACRFVDSDSRNMTGTLPTQQHIAFYAERQLVARMTLDLLRSVRDNYFPDEMLAASTEMTLIVSIIFLAPRPPRISAISRAVGLSRATVRRRLIALDRRNYVVRYGKGYIMGAGINLPQIRRVLRRHVAIVTTMQRKLAKLTTIKEF